MLQAIPLEASGQEGPAAWEVRVVLDATRHRMRRIRPLLMQTAPGRPEAPSLGSHALSLLFERDLVGPWPGLGPSGRDSRPEHLTGPQDDDGYSGTGSLDGMPMEARELRGVPGFQWRALGDAQPRWTALLDDGGNRVLDLRPPFPVPLVPDEVALETREVVWVLRHDVEGRVAWAAAIGSAGAGDLLWEAYWRDGAADGPDDLDDALAAMPGTLIYRVVERYGTPESWHPLRAAARIPASARYNRVEGLSAQLPVWVNLTPTLRLEAWARLSTTSYPATGGASLVLDRWPNRWGAQAYRRLQDANLWEPAHRLGNSLRALLQGRDDGHYYTAEGLSLWTERIHGVRTWRVEVFAERDRRAEPLTDYHLLHTASDTVSLGPTLQAEDGDYVGLRGVYEQQWGLDLQDGVIIGRLWGGAASGNRDFVSVGGMVEAMKAWDRWAVGVRGGAGRVFGNAPLQRQYFLGGPSNLRGFPPASAEGPMVILGRLEVGYGPPVLRIVGFGDAGGAGVADSVHGLAAVGAGFSFAEGLLRLDFAKAVHGGSGFRIYLSGHGLL